MPSLTDIATTIRKHSPGVLPEHFYTNLSPPLDGRCWIVHPNLSIFPQCPDSIAEAVLRDAMVRDANLERWYDEWRAYNPEETSCIKEYADEDHGGSLGACFQAWKWAKGIE